MDDSAPEHHGPEEVHRALADLLESEGSVRLMAIARLHARKCRLDADDLFHEACVLSMCGDRRWPRDVPMLTFLAGVMRSIAHGWRKKARRMADKPPDEALIGDDYPTPADMLEEADLLKKALRRFEDDPEVHMLLQALIDGWGKSDLLSLFDEDEIAYATARRRLRRKLNKLSQQEDLHDQNAARENVETR